MKKFSEALAEDREFEIGSEVFKWRYPFWEEMADIFDEDLTLLRNGKAIEEQTTKEAVERTIKRIEVFLDPEGGSLARWGRLAKRKENPIPLHQFGDVYRWLLEVTSGRPTSPPSDSDSGGGSIEATSPEESR